MSTPLARVYAEVGAGGYTKYDGTVEFYGRINALLQQEAHVLDLGAGRGRQLNTSNPLARNLIGLKGKVARVSGIDVDEAVLENPGLDDALVYDGERIPFKDATIDLILSDWVLEHVDEPNRFAREVERVLKPGGWFCARTPHSLSFTAIASRLVPNKLHARVLSTVQRSNREEKDVFPTRYRLNSLRSVSKFFPASRWEHYSYTYSAEPSYYFGSPIILRAMRVLQYLKDSVVGENLFVFVRKRGLASDGAPEDSTASGVAPK